MGERWSPRPREPWAFGLPYAMTGRVADVLTYRVELQLQRLPVDDLLGIAPQLHDVAGG